MDRSQPASSSNLMDTHNRLIADILTRYRSLMMLATLQADEERDNARPETMAVAGISIKMEFNGLDSSIKELLHLSRRIKELWIFGPLGSADPGLGVKEAQLERDVAQVMSIANEVEMAHVRKLAEKHGATWEPLTQEHQSVTASASATTQPEPGNESA